jgi:hypothetical protein
MAKNLSKLIIVFSIAVLFSGCLTSEYKEYRYEINNDGSGTGSIKFVNLISDQSDEEDSSYSDFDELIESYLMGDAFENENPALQITGKQIFEENGELCGLVEFSFTNMTDIGFFRYEDCDCSPLMYYRKELTEKLVESNGDSFAENDVLPVIYWKPDTRSLYLKTLLIDDKLNSISLLQIYRDWKTSRE